MNTATTNLKNDHMHILHLLRLMSNMVKTSDSEISHIETVVDLVKNYADKFHHAKEEDLLFPLMSHKGFSKNHGPIAVMLHEHELGRRYLKGIQDSIPLFINGEKSALQKIYENMNAYIELLSNHIDKENNILFRMADDILDENEQQNLLKKFKEIEKDLNGSIMNYLNRIDELAKSFEL